MLNTSVKELPLSTRVSNTLFRAGIYTINQLTAKTEQQLLVFVPGFGIKALAETRNALAQHNLCLCNEKN